MRLVLISLAVLLSTVIASAIPQLINYQGQLTSPSGTPLDTTVNITFTLYNAPTGGSAVWTETQAGVVVTDGLFHVLLGSVTPLPDVFTINRWLGVTVGGDTQMSPRQQIVSVAHSYRVGTVDGATGGTITGDVIINNKLNVGAGNTNPGSFANVLGQNNLASGNHAFVGGGMNNRAHGDYSTISGGGGPTANDSNSTTGYGAVIGGGNWNQASGVQSVIGGGLANQSSLFYSTVSGGANNTASGYVATVGGGIGNTAAGEANTVSGGYQNSTSGYYATVSGGVTNTSSGDYSTTSGGYNNSVAGSYATIPGGSNCVANGDYSFVAGRNVKTNSNASGTFIWGDNDATDTLVSGIANRVVFRAANGYRLYTADNLGSGVLLNAGDGAWSSVSDSTKKRNARFVDTKQVLQRVSALPIKQWSYKSQDPSVEHVGPMAQDFYAAFHLGESDTTISTIDPDGVMLAAIQELAKRTDQIMELKTQVAQLQAQVQSLLADKQQSGRIEQERKMR